MGPLDFLQEWYALNCDGDWEHEWGVSIETIDNPGWKVRIDLQGTNLHQKELDRTIIENSDDDWIHAWSDGSAFNAACSPLNLDKALALFHGFADSGAALPSTDDHYRTGTDASSSP